ncbi:MAG TPA: hypothetical protein VMR49_02350 [Candidatus Paceibacterota bacterium]|jgi:hypothetical protein|nr:hypothetical protein [Candidatus Paceibacterota bacterium]
MKKHLVFLITGILAIKISAGICLFMFLKLKTINNYSGIFISFIFFVLGLILFGYYVKFRNEYKILKNIEEKEIYPFLKEKEIGEFRNSVKKVGEEFKKRKKE